MVPNFLHFPHWNWAHSQNVQPIREPWQWRPPKSAPPSPALWAPSGGHTRPVRRSEESPPGRNRSSFRVWTCAIHWFVCWFIIIFPANMRMGMWWDKSPAIWYLDIFDVCRKMGVCPTKRWFEWRRWSGPWCSNPHGFPHFEYGSKLGGKSIKSMVLIP